MSVTPSRPMDMFRYDSEFGVLICRPCQYAVERSALSSHLLRHKIYRGERQRLWSLFADLTISEPIAVRPPSVDHGAIECLPIIPGYRCVVDGCGHLCASIKRIRRHWSESHRQDEFATRCASLQTFFPGTHLRYFEVKGKGAENSRHHEDHPNHVRGTEKALKRRRQEGSVTMMSRPSTVSQPRSVDIGGHDDTVDLNTLTYFHHFITQTKLDVI